MAQVDAAIDAKHDVCAFCIPVLASNVLNSKQFETCYWPMFKKIVDRVAVRGESIYQAAGDRDAGPYLAHHRVLLRYFNLRLAGASVISSPSPPVGSTAPS